MGSASPRSLATPAMRSAERPVLSRPLDAAAVATLVQDARASFTDALVIIKDGKLVGDWEFTGVREPIETMSITKSVLSLAVGTLVEAGRLRLDQPAHELYPEWSTGKRREITLRHLLSHTSGLDEGKSTREIYGRKSFVKVTLGSKLAHQPGTQYHYSNRGANLVGGIVAKASGMATERYVAKVLFEPLGIKRYSWARDGAGQAQGMAGLRLLPRDLAKIGELLLSGGVHQGAQIVSSEWLDLCTKPGPVQPSSKRLGLFWWLSTEWTGITIDDGILSRWREAGVDAAFFAKVAPLVHRRFESSATFVGALRELFADPKLEAWNQTTWERGLPDAHFEFGPVNGFFSAGTLGQYLVVLPRDGIVAVRMRRAPRKRSERDDMQRTFPDFVERIQSLVHQP